MKNKIQGTQSTNKTPKSGGKTFGSGIALATALTLSSLGGLKGQDIEKNYNTYQKDLIKSYVLYMSNQIDSLEVETQRGSKKNYTISNLDRYNAIENGLKTANLPNDEKNKLFEKLKKINTNSTPEVITETTKSFTSIQDIETQYSGFEIQNPNVFLKETKYIIKEITKQGNNRKPEISNEINNIKKIYGDNSNIIILINENNQKAYLLIPENWEKQNQEKINQKTNFETNYNNLKNEIEKELKEESSEKPLKNPFTHIKTRYQLKEMYPEFGYELNNLLSIENENILNNNKDKIILNTLTEQEKTNILKSLKTKDESKGLNLYIRKYSINNNLILPF